MWKRSHLTFNTKNAEAGKHHVHGSSGIYVQKMLAAQAPGPNSLDRRTLQYPEFRLFCSVVLLQQLSAHLGLAHPAGCCTATVRGCPGSVAMGSVPLGVRTLALFSYSSHCRILAKWCKRSMKFDAQQHCFCHHGGSQKNCSRRTSSHSASAAAQLSSRLHGKQHSKD